MLNLLRQQASLAKLKLVDKVASLRITRLHEGDTTPFPSVGETLSHPEGLVAIGGDLSPERLAQAYRSGIFPWYQPGEDIHWWSPDPRSITIPGQIRLTKNLRRLVRQSRFFVTLDQAFDDVILACAAPRPNSEGTWISNEMLKAYRQLHQLGHAHSVEVWQDGELAGGQFGVSFGAAFFGESMFSRASNASKIGFVHLAQQLHQWGYQLIDGQFPNAHMTSLGSIIVSRQEYLQRLEAAVSKPCRLGRWHFDESFNPLDSTASAPPDAHHQ